MSKMVLPVYSDAYSDNDVVLQARLQLLHACAYYFVATENNGIYMC